MVDTYQTPSGVTIGIDDQKNVASDSSKPIAYDAGSNSYKSPVPGAVPSSEYFSRVGNEPKPVVAQTADEIQQQKLSRAQGMINDLNKKYDSDLAEQTTVNEGRTRGTDALSTLTGLAGSSEANVQATKTAQINARDIDAINNERSVAIQGILGKISDAAVLEAKQSRDEARQSGQDIMAYREKAATDAVQHLTELSKMGSGTTIEGLKATLNPDEYNYLVKNAGGEDAVKAILFNNRPKSTLVGTPTVVGNYIVQHYTNPDGTSKTEYVALPKEVQDSIAADPKNVQIEKTDNGLFFLNKADHTWTQVPGSGSTGGTKPVVSGTLKVTPEDISHGVALLNNSKGKDKYADPSVYQQMYDKWVAGGGKPQDFIKQYPPKNYINPANTDLPAYLRSNSTKSTVPTPNFTNATST